MGVLCHQAMAVPRGDAGGDGRAGLFGAGEGAVPLAAGRGGMDGPPRHARAAGGDVSGEVEGAEGVSATFAYPLIVQPLPEADGGGYMAIVPDLPGCMSDGETPVEAVENVQDAIACRIEAAEDMGHVVPGPSAGLVALG